MALTKNYLFLSHMPLIQMPCLLPLKKSLSMAVKETRHESRALEFHNNLRQGYLEMAKLEPERFVVLNADKNIEQLHIDIVQTIKERFKL